ncbi:hypothetical protein HJG60_008387 [Phyllostomus discolor]|uniref:Uncharacterized protein n=1 Tax=Phyllostomus discolor TaxID=89673 RepID=A0A834DM75_9CHIR|nr:hypothetical protein HJG60_008387 [Phyllostomus discolor]
MAHTASYLFNTRISTECSEEFAHINSLNTFAVFEQRGTRGCQKKTKTKTVDCRVPRETATKPEHRKGLRNHLCRSPLLHTPSHRTAHAASCPGLWKHTPPQNLPGQETGVFLFGADLSVQACVLLSLSGRPQDSVCARISSGLVHRRPWIRAVNPLWGWVSSIRIPPLLLFCCFCVAFTAS